MPDDQFRVLTVCLGNVCRSPAAELLLRRAGLPGVEVRSAGLGAPAGHPVAPEIATLLEADGIDASGHRATPMSPRHLAEADLVLTMTAAQRTEVIDRAPRLVRRAFTAAELAHLAGLPQLEPSAADAAGRRAWVLAAAALRSQARGHDLDIADPWGRSPEDYAVAYQQVRAACSAIARALQGSAPVPVTTPT